MKISINRLAITSLLLITPFFVLLAQPRAGRMDQNEMTQREKQNLYKELADLSGDQKLLLDGIYAEFADAFTELREEVRKTRDWANMRPKMMALRKEKDEIIADVLNSEQFAVYQKLTENRRNRQRQPPQENQEIDN